MQKPGLSELQSGVISGCPSQVAAPASLLASCFAFRTGKLLAQGSFKTSVEEVIIASLILASGSSFPFSSWSD